MKNYHPEFPIASGHHPFRVNPVEAEIDTRIEKGRSVITAQTELLHRTFGRSESQWKHDGTRVTAVDLEISRRVFADLGERFRDDQFFSEEGDPSGPPQPVSSRIVWILDPVDGTNNFALGIPVVAISLALLVDGEPVYGFIYDMGARRLYHGGPGRGLWVDDERVERLVPEKRDTTIVAMHSPMNEDYLPLVTAVLRDCKIRAFGSGALHLAHVAYGRMDASLDFTIKVWDIAAAVAFCRESGIELTFFAQNPFPVRFFDVRMKSTPYLASRPELMKKLRAQLPISIGEAT